MEAEAAAEAVKGGNEARRDRGQGSHPEARARQMEIEAKYQCHEITIKSLGRRSERPVIGGDIVDALVPAG